MSCHGPYYFTHPTTGKSVSVTVYVDPHKIAELLVRRALANKNDTARSCHGAVLVKAHTK